MDNFRVEIDVQSYLTFVDGRRVYRRGRTWDFAAGRDLSVAQLTAVVKEQFQWSSDQRMTIWHGAADGGTVPLISESEIAEQFDLCTESRTLRFGVTIESKNNGSDHVTADKESDEPVHAPFFFWPNQAYAGEYEDDEPVQEEKPVLVKAPQNEPDVVAIRIPLGTLDVDNSYDEQNVPGDDESMIATNVVPTHIHDRNCPQIKEKSTFVDGKTFKVALRQLAIREEWSFNTEYSDKKRLRASCSDKDCPWRIHAAKLEGCNTFMVKKLPFAHTKFKAAYEPILMPIRGQSQWPKAQPDFEMVPPKLSRSAGRPRTRRFKSSNDGGRKHVCKRCGVTGHLKKTCKEPEPDSDADRDATPLPKRQQTSKPGAATTSTPPCTPTKQVSEPSIATSSPMTRMRAAALANASSPPSASTRSKTTTNSPLKQV